MSFSAYQVASLWETFGVAGGSDLLVNGRPRCHDRDRINMMVLLLLLHKMPLFISRGLVEMTNPHSQPTSAKSTTVVRSQTPHAPFRPSGSVGGGGASMPRSFGVARDRNILFFFLDGGGGGGVVVGGEGELNQIPGSGECHRRDGDQGERVPVDGPFQSVRDMDILLSNPTQRPCRESHPSSSSSRPLFRHCGAGFAEGGRFISGDPGRVSRGHRSTCEVAAGRRAARGRLGRWLWCCTDVLGPPFWRAPLREGVLNEKGLCRERGMGFALGCLESLSSRTADD